MNNLFDDLFDQFFGDFLKKYNSNGLREYFKMIAEGKIKPLNEDAYEYFNIDENNPDEVIYEEKYGIYIKTQIWRTQFGDITYQTFSDRPFEDSDSASDKTQESKESITDKKKLESMLTKALNEENYEEAARIRDLITPPTKTKKTRKTREKKNQK